MRKPTSATTAESAAKTTPCCIKVGLKRGPWTPEEDELLVNYIKKEGEGRWRTLPKKAGLLRCGKSCRLRWMNYLRPSVKRGQIADDEEDLILRLHRLLGNRWSLIAGRIPGRTDNEIKNYWNTHLSKKLISQGIDPRTHKPLNPQSFDQSKPSLSKANLHQARLKEPIKNIVSSGLEEATSGSTRIINRENEYFQNNSNAHLDDQYHADYFIASHGYTSLLNYDGTSGMDLRGDQRLGIVEADQDINSGTDDVFSFLNSLIDEEALQQHQILNVPNVNCAPPSSDPFVSIAATTFGLGTGWESTLMSLVAHRVDRHGAETLPSTFNCLDSTSHVVANSASSLGLSWARGYGSFVQSKLNRNLICFLAGYTVKIDHLNEGNGKIRSFL